MTPTTDIPAPRPHVGFVLERSLGHITHADNLSRLLPEQDLIEPRIVEVPWETSPREERLPLYSSNWTVRSGLRARRAIRGLRRDGPLDALFIHTQVPAVLSPDHLARVPTVVSLDATPLQYDELGEHYDHEAGPEWLEAAKWRLNRLCLRRAQHVVTWSSWAKDGVVDGYGIDPAKITVIAPGVPTAMWHVERDRTPSESTVRILFVGGALERKGGDVLLDAFRELRRRTEATAGDTDIELHLVTKTAVDEEPGVVVHHDLGPNSPGLIELYRRADVFCLPTRGDCLPMVLSEAGAAGLPLVSTAVAGIPEIVRDGETGLVVPPGDATRLADALARLVEDRDLRRRLGEEAQAVVDRDFDAAKNVDRLSELLAGLANGSTAG